MKYRLIYLFCCTIVMFGVLVAVRVSFGKALDVFFGHVYVGSPSARFVRAW